MTIGKIIAGIVVIALIAGGGMWYMGMWDPQKPLEVKKPPETKSKNKDLYKEADRFRTMKKWAEALEAYDDAINALPNDHRAPEAAYWIAWSHHELDHKEEAITAFKAFHKDNPGHKKAAHARKILANKYGISVN